MSKLEIWSWILLATYLAGMVALGLLARARVASGDDFATARRSYSPLFLAFAFAATVASGGTFIGFPAIAYDAGTLRSGRSCSIRPVSTWVCWPACAW